MTRPEQGRFDETLDVTHDRTIQGAVTDGATVRSGCTLAVQGAAAGHFVIEADGILTVQGTLAGTFHNDGTLLIAGVITADLPTMGRVAVAAGTLFTQKGALILRPTGDLEPVADGENIQVDAWQALVARQWSCPRTFASLDRKSPSSGCDPTRHAVPTRRAAPRPPIPRRSVVGLCVADGCLSAQ